MQHIQNIPLSAPITRIISVVYLSYFVGISSAINNTFTEKQHFNPKTKKLLNNSKYNF